MANNMEKIDGIYQKHVPNLFQGSCGGKSIFEECKAPSSDRYVNDILIILDGLTKSSYQMPTFEGNKFEKRLIHGFSNTTMDTGSPL